MTSAFGCRRHFGTFDYTLAIEPVGSFGIRDRPGAVAAAWHVPIVPSQHDLGGMLDQSSFDSTAAMPVAFQEARRPWVVIV